MTESYAYISGPLQAAVDLRAARERYERLADLCQTVGLGAYLPHLSTDPEANASASPADVFAQDYQQVRNASLLIACVGQPSSGVGAEIGIAWERRVPVIAIWHTTERPSRFLEGLLRSHSDGSCVIYESDEDLTNQLRPLLSLFKPAFSTSSHLEDVCESP